MNRRHTHLCFGIAVLAVVASPSLAKLRPLPIDVALQVKDAAYDISPDGSLLARLVQEQNGKIQLSIVPASGAGPAVFVGPMMRGQSVRWSPDSRRLIFVAEHDGAFVPWLWEKGRQARPLDDARMGEYQAPIAWLPDSRHLLVSILPEGEPASVEVLGGRPGASFEATWKPVFPSRSAGGARVLVETTRPRPRTTELVLAPTSDGEFKSTPPAPCAERDGLCDLALVDTQTGSVRRLVRRQLLSWFAVSPNGEQAAVVRKVGGETNDQYPRVDVDIVDLDGNQRTIVRRATMADQSTVSWSPDGRKLAMLELGSKLLGRISILDAQTGVTLQQFNAGREGYGSKGDRAQVRFPRAPLWNSDGRYLFQQSTNGDLWRIDAESGHEEKLSLDENRPLGNLLVDATVRHVSERLYASYQLVDDRSVSGIAEIDLASGRVRSVREDRTDPLVTRDASVDGKWFTYRIERADLPPTVNLFNITTGISSRPSGSVSPVEAYSLGESRVIHYHGKNGSELSASLLLPPDWDGETRLPLLVWIYGGAMGSEEANTFGLSGISLPVFNFQILASRGYAVLNPDAPINLGTPMRDIADAVEAGVDAAIAQGYADPDRLAIMGHSYGSYSVMSVITATDRFRAAEISGVTNMNLVGKFQYTNPGWGDSSPGFMINGQGRMGVTPWEDPDRYRDNSPFWLLPNVETPLLIVNGEVDPVTPFADELFMMMRVLGKTAEFRLYEAEGHGLVQPANVIDLWNRRLEFYAEHLDLALDESGAIIFENGRAKSRGDQSESLASVNLQQD